MNNGTLEKLHEITTYPLLENVGQPVADASIQVRSWPEAIRYCSSPIWKDCLVMPTNTLSRLAHESDWYRAHEWNNIAIEMDPHIESWLQAVFSPIASRHQLPRVVRDTLSWCVGFICFESEFQDIVSPLFYLPLIDPWLKRGHFPCGWVGEEFPENWDGKLPNGKLVIY